MVVTDGAGNRNNVLNVPVVEEKPQIEEQKTREVGKDEAFLTLTEKDAPVIKTAEVAQPIETTAHEDDEHKTPAAEDASQSSTFVKQLDGNAEKEPEEDTKTTSPATTIQEEQTSIENTAEEPQPAQINSPEDNVSKSGNDVEQLDGNTRGGSISVETSDTNTPEVFEAEPIARRDTHDIAQECPVQNHDLKEDTYSRQYDGTSTPKELQSTDSALAEGIPQHNYESAEAATSDIKPPVPEDNGSDLTTKIVAPHALKGARGTMTGEEQRKDSVIDISKDVHEAKEISKAIDGSLLQKQDVLPENPLKESSTTPEMTDFIIGATPHSNVPSDLATEKTATLELINKDITSTSVDEAANGTTSSSSAPTAIDLPPRIKSRSPSPGQLFSKAHLLRLQEKRKSPPIKEDVTGQDYLDQSSPPQAASPPASASVEKTNIVPTFSEAPHTPPMSRRTSSRKKQSPRPALLSETVGRSLSDELPSSKERVFPVRRQKSHDSSSPGESDKSIDGIIAETKVRSTIWHTRIEADHFFLDLRRY